MIDMDKKEPKRIIAHFYVAGLVRPISEHGLEIGSEFFYSGGKWVFLMKVLVIVNVPPITFNCPVT